MIYPEKLFVYQDVKALQDLIFSLSGKSGRRRRKTDAACGGSEVTGQLFAYSTKKSIATRLLSTNSTARRPDPVGGATVAAMSWTHMYTPTERNITTMGYYYYYQQCAFRWCAMTVNDRRTTIHNTLYV